MYVCSITYNYYIYENVKSFLHHARLSSMLYASFFTTILLTRKRTQQSEFRLLEFHLICNSASCDVIYTHSNVAAIFFECVQHSYVWKYPNPFSLTLIPMYNFCLLSGFCLGFKSTQRNNKLAILIFSSKFQCKSRLLRSNKTQKPLLNNCAINFLLIYDLIIVLILHFGKTLISFIVNWSNGLVARSRHNKIKELFCS